MRPVASLALDRRGRPVGPGGVTAALGALAAALDGSGPALAPAVGAGSPAAPAEVADDVALLLPTSGSSGPARLVELTAEGLLASASAGSRRLGGPGGWLLALPLSHVAGWQVLTRCLVAGTGPLVVDARGDDWPEAFAAALHAPSPGDHAVRHRPFPGDHAVRHRPAAPAAPAAAPCRRYAALVPTQLARLLDSPRGTAAAASLDAVLLGGAATPAPLAARAAAAGVRVVAGYGMTETSGGCVYDGDPLDDVEVRVDVEGRVHLAGPVLARGYHGAAACAGPAAGGDVRTGFTTVAGRRWFATADAGRLDGKGRLQVLGRLDDVIVTGGEKVAPAAVEAVLAGVEGVREALVVGVADPEWGQLVVALVVPGTPAPRPEAARDAVRERFGAAATPREVLLVTHLPRRGIGKPDRAAAAALAAHRLGARSPAPPGSALRPGTTPQR